MNAVHLSRLFEIAFRAMRESLLLQDRGLTESEYEQAKALLRARFKTDLKDVFQEVRSAHEGGFKQYCPAILLVGIEEIGLNAARDYLEQSATKAA